MTARMLWLLMLTLPLTAFADVIQGDIRDITGGVGLNLPVRFTPTNAPTLLTASNAVAAGPSRTVIPRSGKFTNELAGGIYNVKVGSYSWYIAVPGDGGTYSLEDLDSADLITYLYTNAPISSVVWQQDATGLHPLGNNGTDSVWTADATGIFPSQ